MIKIGVTERGDGGLDLSWANKLCPANIIITKNITSQRFKDLLCEHQAKIILHMGVTGRGGSAIEPHVPTSIISLGHLELLLSMGFPVSQVVLRLDPVIPDEYGLECLAHTLGLFKNSGVTRVRYSFMDMYNHVKIRFANAAITIPYDTFHAPIGLRKDGLRIMSQFQDNYTFEACAEPLVADFPFIKNTGCVSHIDLAILGMSTQDSPVGFQRSLCACLSGKTELLTKPKPCAHKCLFCYWKD